VHKEPPQENKEEKRAGGSVGLEAKQVPERWNAADYKTAAPTDYEYSDFNEYEHVKVFWKGEWLAARVIEIDDATETLTVQFDVGGEIADSYQPYWIDKMA
jgi:hypothetical protein